MNKLSVFLFVFSLLVFPARTYYNTGKIIIWKLKDTGSAGNFKAVKLGNPFVKIENGDTSLYFNGINDGLIIPVIPIEGWSKFTIEVLFKPAGEGTPAPRFIHFEDTASNRGTFELRLTRNSQWYLDVFLKNGKTNKGLTLIDSTKLHTVNKWYWAALVYDGKKMYSFINGQKELEGEIDFPAMKEGRISLGMRLNKVNWYKGQISEIRFHPVSLDAKALQHH